MKSFSLERLTFIRVCFLHIQDITEIVMVRARYLRFLICVSILFPTLETLNLITKLEDTLGEIMPFKNLPENLMNINK